MKDLQTRISEITAIYQKLADLGISREAFADFRKIANNFVRDGSSASGSLPLRGLQRDLVYKLSNHTPSNVTLRFNKHT